jgi:hypothetical protein
MNHPKCEEWVPYLYGESRPEARQQLKQHLQVCAECREQLEAWQRSLGRLDAWKLPRRRAFTESVAPLLKWAAAAAIVLGLGFGFGRLTASRADAERVRALIEPEIRRQLSQEFAQLVREETAKVTAATLAAANRLTEDTIAEYSQTLYAALKRDLDTVAVNADAGLQRTEQQLVQLAGYAQPANTPVSP